MRRLHSFVVTTAALPEMLHRFDEVLVRQANAALTVYKQIASIEREICAIQPAMASIQHQMAVLLAASASTSNATEAPQNIHLQQVRQQLSAMSQGMVRLGEELQSLRSAFASEFLDIQRSVVTPAECNPEPEIISPLRHDSIEVIFGRLMAEYPRAFPVWKELFENSQGEYVQAPLTSLSVVGHAVAARFGEYILEHGGGALLDIGCGPQSFPIYLRGYPIAQIAGIDPLRPTEPHPFVFCQTVMEEIPWPDSSFKTIVIATSLDHALDLRRALCEIDRVLLPSGRVIIWVGFVEEARFFDPHIDEPNPVDQWHLFHFDKNWFERLMLERFLMTDRYRINDGEFFYSFRKRGRVISLSDHEPAVNIR